MTDPELWLDDSLLAESAEDLYEHAPCGYFSTLPDGTFARVNQTFLTWIGYSREELLWRKRFQDLLTLGGKIFHETHYAPLLRMQGTVNEVAFDLVGGTGQQLPVLVNTVQKRNPVGEPLLNRTTVFNATDRRCYERELLKARRTAEQAAEAKSRLLAVISHEIRSPLSTIAMLAEILQRTAVDERQEKHLHRLKSASQHLAELVNDLLDYSKLEAGKMPLDRREFSVRELLEGVGQRLQSRAEQKGLPLQVEIDEWLPERLIGDPLKLNQVLTNLIGNAIKFTEQGFVRVTVAVIERHPDAVSIQVAIRDTGIGIPQDRLPDI
ncbi:MAG: multi-sensor hybrid histidine kinase [Armatimonadetes bacterium]|nr:multi-sensor hybrid histidine kinase [Armatimonadota bacterium]